MVYPLVIKHGWKITHSCDSFPSSTPSSSQFLWRSSRIFSICSYEFPYNFPVISPYFPYDLLRILPGDPVWRFIRAHPTVCRQVQEQVKRTKSEPTLEPKTLVACWRGSNGSNSGFFSEKHSLVQAYFIIFKVIFNSKHGGWRVFKSVKTSTEAVRFSQVLRDSRSLTDVNQWWP